MEAGGIVCDRVVVSRATIIFAFLALNLRKIRSERANRKLALTHVENVAKALRYAIKGIPRCYTEVAVNLSYNSSAASPEPEANVCSEASITSFVSS